MGKKIVTYSTGEMIDWIKAKPTLKFEAEICGVKSIVSIDKDGDLVEHENCYLQIDNNVLNAIWTEYTEEKVTMEEALDVFENKGIVKVICEEGEEYTYDGSNHVYLLDENETGITPGELLRGTWYILKRGE